MGRVLGVDWGKHRVGLALSDETRTICRPLPTLTDLTKRDLVAEIVSITRREGVDTVVVGHPVRMSGEAGPSAHAAGHLADAIAAGDTTLRVLLWDERLTSREAAEILHERGEKTRKGSGRLDQVAAAVLLQSYLDSEGP